MPCGGFLPLTFGWQALPFILLLAASLGLLAILAAMAIGRTVDGATRVPLGTFLAVAAVPGWWLSMLTTGAGA
ncbi:Type 4 prepilin-like proteins leader peptide-processing enzyme [Sphingobium chlorophenolicum]|uniref:Type 4 prepilin-like proteins leader peptide-processing enzyme n=1 Tax=Sphingobium chlorophenolicum TaxID=46429 RepID=A0A081RFJ0_SPHCR|nr:Type 4 prepilin-like proteins leader peptide-processing enzyme [Sphingobium chlorophenolicum]